MGKAKHYFMTKTNGEGKEIKVCGYCGRTSEEHPRLIVHKYRKMF